MTAVEHRESATRGRRSQYGIVRIVGDRWIINVPRACSIVVDKSFVRCLIDNPHSMAAKSSEVSHLCDSSLTASHWDQLPIN